MSKVKSVFLRLPCTAASPPMYTLLRRHIISSSTTTTRVLSRKKISEIYIRFITWTLYEIVFSISPIQIFRASEMMYKNTSSIFSLLIRLLASWFCKGARIFFTNDLCQPTKHIIFSLKVSQLHMQYLTSSSVIKKNGFPPCSYVYSINFERIVI